MQATVARRPPLRPGTGGDVLNCVFEHDGQHWCIEELGLADKDDSVGFYAYNTKRWASATLRLDERCRFFDEAMLKSVEGCSTSGPIKTSTKRSFVKNETGDRVNAARLEYTHGT